MTLDHYVSLGHSGLRVSPMCLGTMTFGEDWDWGASVDESQRMLDRYADLGGNFIDTANLYTLGHAEKIIGDHLGKDVVRRQRNVIATKFFGSMRSGDPNAGGAGRKNIIAACEESLRRLQTDYIDLYWMHCWDVHTPIEETMRALDDLVRAGKVRYVGFSDTPAWKVAEAQMLGRQYGWTPLIALQIEYSLLERSVEGELVPMAQQMGLGVMPWSPLRSGVLTGKYSREQRGTSQPSRGKWVTSLLNDAAYDVVDALVEIAKQADTTPSRVALAWLQHQPAVASIVIGARSVRQMEDNLAALHLHLSEEHMQRLADVSRPTLSFPVEFVRNAGPFRSSDTTINGETSAQNYLAAQDGQSYY